MNPEQYERFIYEEARKFLLAQEVEGLDAALLDKYLQPPAGRRQISGVPQIYERLLMSMQSGNMKAGVIGGSIGGVQRLGRVLDCNRTPYDVDKLFWLIGSGSFYDDPQIGKNGRIGSFKGTFIEYNQDGSE